ncbi:IS21 family transposase [Nakamurella sp. YIM 132087]|uniref:IS21 family transposase n=2 Tax=Nakamurella alba TaxID=2665158 RepID=A0A7K1FHF8_9ACTN|nr:IS21 family transposase [Nakamurella alba]
MDIISAYREVGTYRGAAVLCATTHKTVRRVIERAEAAAAGRPRVRARSKNFESVTDLVAGKVASSKGRISAKRLLPVAQAAGYGGSARNFRRLVAEQKALWRSHNHRGRRPAVWEPGGFLVFDWSMVAPGLHLFCAVLAWSRWRFVAFAADERAATTMGLLAEVMHAVGGVPGKLLTDRMACLKGGVVANLVVPTPDYVRFAAHYGFTPDFCHAHDPESKGIVEHLVGYCQRDLVVPLLTGAEPAGRQVGVHEANDAARRWCAEVNARTHSEIAAVPDERLLVEREVLRPLPSLRLEFGPAPVIRKVDRLSCVRFASARYSVPTAMIGRQVRLIPAGGRLAITDPAGRQVLADHPLLAPGQVSVLDAHYDTPRTAPSRAPRPRSEAEKRFCDLGGPAEAFLVGAAAIGNTRLGAELEVLLALGAAHGTEQLLAALGRAVAFGRFRAADVRSILAAGTSAPTPVPAGGALVVDLPVATMRSLADYNTAAITGHTSTTATVPTP